MQTHQSIIDLRVSRAGELDHVHLDAVLREIFLQRRDQLFRLLMIERAVEQIHADDAERFLLVDIRFIEHPHVNDDLARFAARFGLKTNA